MMRGINHDVLNKVQRTRSDATRDKVLAALRVIEGEIAEHGFYKQNSGRVTLTEVARRADVSAVTLRNQHHHQTRNIIQSRLIKLKLSAPTTKPKARKVARDKISFYEDALRKMNAEALKWRVELTALKEENERLRKQIASMINSTATKVVGFKSRTIE